MYHNNIVGMLRIHLSPSHLRFWYILRQVLKLPGAVRLDVLPNASLRITLTIPELVGTENEDTSNLPYMLDRSSMAKIYS